MPRRRISFDVAVNTPSATREADRLKNIFQSRLNNLQVGTSARGGAGGAGGARGGAGGAGGSGWGMPGSSLRNLTIGSAQFAIAGLAYQFFSNLPKNIMELDRLATSNRRAAASFATLAGGMDKANSMVTAFVQGSGNISDRVTATTEAMRLFNIGIVEDAEQMRTFTALSRGMSQSLGKDVNYIQEQFSLALANQSMLRFDQLGLSIERHQELMKELGQEYPNLTREVLFQNAMLQQAMERYYNLSNAQQALATTTEIATRTLKDQGQILAEIVSKRVVQPIAGQLAAQFGAGDYNLNTAVLRNQVDEMRWQAQRRGEGPGPLRSFLHGAFNPESAEEYRENIYKPQTEWLEDRAKMGESLIELGETLAAAANLNVEIDPAWVETLNAAGVAMNDANSNTAAWTGRIEAQSLVVRMAIEALGGMNDVLTRTSSAADIAAARMEQLGDLFTGAVTGMVGKLVKAGVSPEGIRGMLPSQDEIDTRARDMSELMAIEGGDVVDREIIAQTALNDLLSESEGYLDAQEAAASAQKRAATEMEQAAREAEKAFLSAADGIKDAYSDMLRKIPGVFGTSEVTEEDLELAKLGLPTNFADDALRRLEDVAFNKKERPEVDMGAWAQALRLPEGTDPKALAIYARRAWESGELWANPQNIERFMNTDAAKGELRGQELAALGQQNLEAFFGIGTEQGNEFLRVFGMEALDPIQDGLITEVTTRGPIMGESLAEAMHTGFSRKALELPWVASIMSSINSEIGRQIIAQVQNGTIGASVGRQVVGEMNADANSDTAIAEGLP